MSEQAETGDVGAGVNVPSKLLKLFKQRVLTAAMRCSAASRSAALVAPFMDPANSTPVRGDEEGHRRLGVQFQPGDGLLLPFTVRVTCTPRLAGSGEALRIPSCVRRSARRPVQSRADREGLHQ